MSDEQYYDEYEDYEELEEKYGKKDFTVKLMTPKQIKKELDKVVIGQERAKIILANEIYKQMIKINNKKLLKNSTISKSNIIMTGLTGTGKTLLAQVLAKTLKVPFAIADATTLTSAGYVGEDVENILLKLIQAADYDIKKAEQGIVYIDEIDKIARKGENVSITRDVSGEGVQEALLKILEGTIASVPPQGGRKHPQQEMLKIDTTNILFIGGGSFEGIENIVNERLNRKNNQKCIGFNSTFEKSKDMNLKELRNNISTQDLKRFGMMPELLGRFPIIANLEPLEEKDLINILKVKTGIISEYKTLFKLQNKTLDFAEDAYKEIASIAIKENIGARGLRAIIENIMIEIMFNAPSEDKTDYVIDSDLVINKYNKQLNIA